MVLGLGGTAGRYPSVAGQQVDGGRQGPGVWVTGGEEKGRGFGRVVVCCGDGGGGGGGLLSSCQRLVPEALESGR